MKLIIKQYLSSLKERDELDILLPDLLAMMGLNVFSKPSIGTRQYGVDVAAFGRIDEEEEKVYLFSIKGGNLDRKDWNSGNVQDLQPSLDEIRDTYIPTHLPSEYKNKPIEICICFGGSLKETIRLNVTQYEDKYKNKNLTFSEWSGDKLTQLIEQYFLNENLLPKNFQSMLRKSLALLDEPNISYKHFSQLVHALSKAQTDKDRIKALRQLRISLGILIAWCKEADNLESAYLSAELSLLNAWEMAKPCFGKTTKDAVAMQESLQSIVSAYLLLCDNFLQERVLPHIDKKHALSQAIHPSNRVDTNLKVFDLLGRVAMCGIWLQRAVVITKQNNNACDLSLVEQKDKYYLYVRQLINNNPMLFTPYKDEQAIDIVIAIYFLMRDPRNNNNIYRYLLETLNRINFNFNTHSNYPCNINEYHKLIEYPLEQTEEYRKENTKGSILYPYIAFFAAYLGFDDIYEIVQNFKKENLQHCNFQLWYPDETSEEMFYTNKEMHGAALNGVFVDRDKTGFLKQLFDECDETSSFQDMSAIKSSFYPIIFLGCRHYRLPIPIHFFKPKTTQ